MVRNTCPCLISLYASINQLDGTEQNVMTIEDPIEYRFKDIKQVQVNEKAGLTFPGALRAMMRLDPDIILVGEIRDSETALTAVQAALTGHLVLSSIHANDAARCPVTGLWTFAWPPSRRPMARPQSSDSWTGRPHYST